MRTVLLVLASFVVLMTKSLLVKETISHIWYHQRPKIHNPSETIPSGLCCVYKPKGWSTHEAANRVKYLLQNELRFIYEFKKPRIKVSYFERKLDRQAEGVLLLAVGAAFPLLPKYIEGESVFKIEGHFFATEDVKDEQGRETSLFDMPVTSRDIERILPKFRGTIRHQPPFDYHGLQMNQETIDYINGGVWPETPPFDVHISKLELDQKTKTSSMPYFKLKMRCDGDTFPRTVLEDMAKELKSGLNIDTLTRIEQSGFNQWHTLDIERCSYEDVKENIVNTSSKVGMDVTLLEPAEKYRMQLMKSGNMQQRNRLRREEKAWLLAMGGEDRARPGSGLDQASEPSFFDFVDFQPHKKRTEAAAGVAAGAGGGGVTSSGGTHDDGEDESSTNTEDSNESSSAIEQDNSIDDDDDVMVRGEDPSTMEITDEL